MKFLIADDHAVVRKGLSCLIREEFPSVHIEEAGNYMEALEKATADTWDVILLDINMPGGSGMDVLAKLRSAGITTPILMLSMQPEEQYATRALRTGASGYINKDSATEELTKAIHKLLDGKKYISQEIANMLAHPNSPDGGPGAHLLSNREMQVLQLIAAGKTLTEIAMEIRLSINTVSTYRTRILDKLQLHNNAELTRYAIDNGLS